MWKTGRSSGLHPISSHSCWMYVGHPAFARPYLGVHRCTSLMSSSLLLQQCPACLVRLTWIVFMMGGRWPYSWYLVGVLPPGLFQYCSQHSCVIAVELLLQSFSLKAWAAIDRLSIIWKSDLTDKMKRSFFQAAVISLLLYGCTTWTLI